MNQRPATKGKPERTRSGFPNWLYLVFLVFLLLGPVFDTDAGAEDWALAIGAIVVSAVIYLLGLKRQTLRNPAAVALIVLGVGVTWLGSAAMGVVPIYAAALASGFVDKQTLVRRLAIITAVTLASMLLSPIPVPYIFMVFVPAIPLIWLIGYSVHADMNLHREAHTLRAENARIQYLATVTERERIARDLHDLAGQALTAVALRSQLVQRLAATDPERAVAEAEAIESTARETLSSLRETVAGWRQVDLRDELDKGTKTLEAASVGVDVVGDWQRDLAPSVETILALALREGVTNVVRHSQANSCRISLDGDPGMVSLEIVDDGAGVRAPEGSGLSGMRERVVAAGGTMEVVGSPGTTLRISIPVGGSQ